MKYSTNSSETHSSALFCEQVQQITNIFEQWSDCERTVVIYTLFKRLPFHNLKFLIHAIDHHLRHGITTPQQHMMMLEEAANKSSFLNKLIHKYNMLTTYTSSTENIDACSDQELSSCADSSKSLENDLVAKYNSKDEIVFDLLTYLPMLRPNNDEGKKVYIHFFSMLIEDSTKHNLSIELVQQVLSYMIIHPAFKSDDRKQINQFYQKIHDHMNSYPSSSIGGSSNHNFLSSDNATSFMSTTSSMSSVSSSSSASSTTWPTAVPQIQTNASSSNNNSNVSGSTDVFKTNSDREFWDLRNFQVTQDFCDDLNQAKYPLPIGNNSTSQNNNNNNSNSASSNAGSASLFDTNDEHHISFSKNGTDVDFDNEFDGKTTGSAVNAPSTTSDFLTVPNFFNDRLFNDMYGYGGALSDGFSDDGNNTIKTRRSNSLTTPTCQSGDFISSSSAENLANLQKPRSFSLSMESSRNALMSCGSETRLDKLAQMQMNCPYQIGMGNIAVWLKSLRLHKYLWLFTNMSYEYMMDMTEEYLENLGVTKGARHKLVLCIQKLSERVGTLKQIEKELMDGTKPLKIGLDEVTNIILTPMKPINSVPCEEDVATHVMRVLDCAFQIMQSIKYLSNADEECVNVFLWVLDKSLHHEAFIQQTAHLKEYKYKLQRIKMMFANKMYNGNTGNQKGNNMKMRWTKNKMINNSNQNISDGQKNRKNSMPYYNIQQYQSNQSLGSSNSSSSNNPKGNSKSLSYPNFGTQHNTPSNLNSFQRSASREKLNQFTLMQQQHHVQYNQGPQNSPSTGYHRNSLNSLMPFSMQQQQQFANRRNSCGMSPSMSSPLGSNEKILSISPIMSASLTPTTTTTKGSTANACDINSRLESLCRQMTEQAIN